MAQIHDRLTKTRFSQRQGTARKIRRYVEQAAESGERIDRVERELFARLLEQGLTLLRAFVDGQGDGDAGPSVKVDIAELRRLSGPRARKYLSVFGGLVIMRRVYEMPEGQKIQHVPLDARPGLPAGKFLYVLMDWLQRRCVKESFHEAATDLRVSWFSVNWNIAGQG